MKREPGYRYQLFHVENILLRMKSKGVEALNCSNCGNPIDTNDDQCIICGAPIQKKKGLNLKAVLMGLVSDIGGSMAAALLLGMIIATVMVIHHSTQDISEILPFKIIMLVIGLLFSGLGGYVAARIANHQEIYHAFITGILSEILGIGLFLIIKSKEPYWYNILSFGLVIPCAIFGGYIRMISKNRYGRSIPTEAKTIKLYAGFWVRLAAAGIDGLLIGMGQIFTGIILSLVFGAVLIGMGGDLNSANIFTITPVFILLAGFVMNWLYFTLSESSSRQATLGKYAFGLMVTDINGNPVSFAKANGRYWSKYLSWGLLTVGFAMAGFTPRKQALHDIIAGTIVVKR